MSAMKKHFVEFFSPGTFFAETTIEEIPSWNVSKAEKMAASVVERYNAKPYGFRFLTRSRGKDDLDSKITAVSRMYFLNGKVETIQDVERRADPKESILLSNMKGNGWKKIVRNKPESTGWAWTQPLNEGDVVL